MASAVGCGSWTTHQIEGFSSSSRKHVKNIDKNKNKKNKGLRVSCVSSAAQHVSSDPYKTLMIHPGASESEVKKAFRKLVLQYHPDVCRGSNCVVQFHQINEAYDLVMSQKRGELSSRETERIYEDEDDDAMRGMNDQDWDYWEEWMGWEGAGIRDYSSHINPYI